MINSQTEISPAPLSLQASVHRLAGINETTLRWQQPKRLRNLYWLCSQEYVLGSLQYNESHFIRTGMAKTAEGEWSFKYTRFALPQVIIRKKNSVIAQTSMETNWGWSGTLILPNGHRFSWKSIDATEKEFRFNNSTGDPLVFFRPRRGLLKLEGQVEIDPSAIRNPQLPLLVTLGWFLVLLRMR